MTKRLAIFLYILAFASLQAHNLISHHHDEEATRVFFYEQLHHSDGDHDSPISHNGHDAEFGKSLVKPEPLDAHIHHPADLYITTGNLFGTSLVNQATRPIRYLAYNTRPHLVFILHDLPLRAPPVASPFA